MIEKKKKLNLGRLETNKIRISARQDENDLIMLFDEAATEPVLLFIEHTAVGKRREEENT